MKKRLIAALAGTLFVTTSLLPAISAKAEPTSVEQARTQYEELKKKVEDINEKVQNLDNDISNLVSQMEDNKSKINDLNDQISDTNNEIELVKEEISDKEGVLGQRLREVYKSGGQTSYLSIIFSADSVSDLISRINSASKIVSLDQKVVKEVVSTKEELDNKVDELQSKQDEIVALNEDINNKTAEKSSKKKEQEDLLTQAKEEQNQFDKLYLSEEERKIVSGPIAVCNNQNSTATELANAISQLRSLRDNQIKSPTVVNEINTAIEAGKTLKATKDAEEAARQAAANERQQSSSNSAAVSSANRGDTSSVGVTGSGSVQALLNEAYKHLGKQYVYGASGPNTFDCSGFTSYVYRVAAGIEIGRTTYDQLNSGRTVSQSELQPGDLVFPHTGHVGIYVGGGMMIHAPQTGDVVKVAPVYRFYTARRIFN